MYGMKPKRKFIDQALEMLAEPPDNDGLVVVFHRLGSLQLEGLVCHQTASYPIGVTGVVGDDQTLDCFTSFVAGFVMQDADAHSRMLASWRQVCRALGCRGPQNTLLFGSPERMVAFSRHATSLPELIAQIPQALDGHRAVKSREARLYNDVNIVRPTEVEHVQRCVEWAVKHCVGLTVIGGGHSGHCVWPNVVSVDMSSFDQVHIISTVGEEKGVGTDVGGLVIAGGGCKTEDIIRASMESGLTVPLGSRPSVGAGLWLQGGIGHLARVHGLACDAIAGAVVVSVNSGHVVHVGHVPEAYRPTSSVRPEKEKESSLLWAIKGAGTNFGIVISVTFKAYAAPTYSVRNWVVPLHNDSEARLMMSRFEEAVVQKLERNWSADAYLYLDNGQLQLGVTLYGVSTTHLALEAPVQLDPFLFPETEPKVVDSVGLFDTEMYISRMHGGHGGGKTSSFKRCLFLKHIGASAIVNVWLAAFEARPSPLCYLHLLQGGGAVGDTAEAATPFGCRDWDFACVITGVWHRDQDGTKAANAAIDWVYSIVQDLLPLSIGVYSADLGPDPRDAILATKAFGSNLPRLAHLKNCFDPLNLLAYACPLPQAPVAKQVFQKLTILVTGESCAGKDFSASVWASVFNASTDQTITARVVSISDTTKRAYAAATGADPDRLLKDRDYKEQHRAALTAYYQDEVQKRPGLPQEHFMDVVYGYADSDVLLITGMRDAAPVASLSHLVTDHRLLEIHVVASQHTRQARGGREFVDGDQQTHSEINTVYDKSSWMGPRLSHQPCLVFDNNDTGTQAVREFAEKSLLPFLDKDLQRLASMVRSVPDFPHLGIEFRHVLDIVQHQGGLPLCISLLKSHFVGDWSNVDAVACCEAGGYVFAAALASAVEVPLTLIREAGKLPPPTTSVTKYPSHVSSFGFSEPREKKMEMNSSIIPQGASVVVVDDVLATGKTLCAVLKLLSKVGVDLEYVSVMVVAEFPAHKGREFLRQNSFSRVRVQSLLVLDGI